MRKYFLASIFVLLCCCTVLPLGCTENTSSKPSDNSQFCGGSPKDWCPSPPSDPCGSHKDTASCKADPLCVGMPYRGESVVACILDERGFASNCPTVGCQSKKKP